MMGGSLWDNWQPCFIIILLRKYIMCLAVPGKIIELKQEDPLFRLGLVDFGGIVREVNLSCVPEAGLGDYVVVHVGIALSIMTEEEAHQSLSEMRDIVLQQEGREAGVKESSPFGRNIPSGS